MSCCRFLILFFIIFSLVMTNQAKNSNEGEDDNSNNQVIYGCDNKILQDLIPKLELVKATNEIINLKLERLETKLEKLEKNDHSQLIEAISKLIDMKFESFGNGVSKSSNEAENDLHKQLDNRLKILEEKTTEILKESLKENDFKSTLEKVSQSLKETENNLNNRLKTLEDKITRTSKEIDSKLSSTANAITENMKMESENFKKSFESQKNEILIPLQKQVEKIQNSTKEPGPKKIEIFDHPKNCAEALENNAFSDGIYNLYVPGVSPFQAYCMRDSKDKNSPPWTIIQRRRRGDVDFYRNWTDYKNGFGDLGNDFWLGLERVYAMTSRKPHELLIDLEDWEGEQRFAQYDNFLISNEEDGYRLNLGEYSGDAGDSLSYNNFMKFTTEDVDNDKLNANCAERHKGAWWYKNCQYSNLNGIYESTAYAEGINWYHWHGWNYSLKYVQMAIRPY